MLLEDRHALSRAWLTITPPPPLVFHKCSPSQSSLLPRGEQANADEFQSNGQPYRAHNKIFGNHAEESTCKEKQFRSRESLVGAKRARFIFQWISRVEFVWADAEMGAWGDAEDGHFRAASEPGRRGRNRKRGSKPSRRSLVT